MITRRIIGANVNFGAPKGWDPERDGDCHHLPVRVSREGELLFFESAWEPTPDELAALVAGGSIILRIVGAQPPVALYVAPPEER